MPGLFRLTAGMYAKSRRWKRNQALPISVRGATDRHCTGTAKKTPGTGPGAKCVAREIELRIGQFPYGVPIITGHPAETAAVQQQLRVIGSVSS